MAVQAGANIGCVVRSTPLVLLCLACCVPDAARIQIAEFFRTSLRGDIKPVPETFSHAQDLLDIERVVIGQVIRGIAGAAGEAAEIAKVYLEILGAHRVFEVLDE